MKKTANSGGLILDPKIELPNEPQDVPLWTEHYMFFGFDPEAGIGAFVHAGREHFDPAMWRINVMAYLPGNELLVAKCRGRDGHARGIGAGPVRITCVELFQHWLVEFDGVVQSVTRDQNNREVIRDDAAEPLRFTLSVQGAAPFWDYRYLHPETMNRQEWASQHNEQISRVTGDFSYRNKYVRLNAWGMRDHSPGPRDYSKVVSDFWINGSFPSGRAFNATTVRTETEGANEIRFAYTVAGKDEPVEMVELIEGPHVNSVDTPAGSIPADIMSVEDLRTFHVILKSSRGIERIDGEILHSVANSYVSPSDELIGTDFNRPQALQLLSCPARFRWGDEVGYGIRERVARIETLHL